MEPIFRNNTKLTFDLYKDGVTESFNSTHRILRAVSIAYAVIMMAGAYLLFIYNAVFAILFFVLGAGILFWTFWGYKMGSKISFMRFAKLHGSHYQVDMEYRFYEDRIEQETSKTELVVMYKDFDIVGDMIDKLVIIFNKQVIVIDNSAFIDCNYEDVVKFLKEKNVKVKKMR